MKRHLVVAVIGMAVLAGCNADDSSLTIVDGSSPTYKTAAELAAKIGCSDYVLSTEDEPKVQDQGVCMLDGHETFIWLFADDQDRDWWLESLKGADYAGSIALGRGWVVQTVTAEGAAKVANIAAGGEWDPNTP